MNVMKCLAALAKNKACGSYFNGW